MSVVTRQASVKRSLKDVIIKDFRRNKALYLMLAPVLIYYILFHYKPMYGAVIAFKNYTPDKGILGSEWVGLKHFADFFGSAYFYRILKNTLMISINTLIFGFPAPIILALLINEIKNIRFSKTVQVISYLPHFISCIVICGMIKEFTAQDGIINDLVTFFGGTRINMLNEPGLFVPIYIISEIWQQAGWNAIIYTAALASIDPQLYEAAIIDGAGRIRQTLYVTLPGIIPTIIITLILQLGHILSVGFEKIILLYNPLVYDTADVISSFVYRKGLQELNWSYSSAVGLFNSAVNFLLIIIANQISRRMSETSLW